MRAVVLAGGRGMRLRPYTTVLPKPLLPVGDRPVLDIIVRQLERAGCERITISTGYLAELIEVFFGDGSKYGVKIDYFREPEPLGTVGSLRMIGDLDEDVLVMNGDILTDLDYRALFDDHCANEAVATIATCTRHVEIALGVPQLDDTTDPSRVTGFVEKPNIDYQASMGVFCVSREAVESIVENERLDLPELLLRLIGRGRVVRAWRSDNYWLDIGQHDDYETAVAEFERMRERLIPE
jgi:NDP-sugar pyrophosphorylase family protein